MNLESILIFGCGGHAKVVSQVIDSAGGYRIEAYVDRHPTDETFLGKPVLPETALPQSANDGAVFVALGSNDQRKQVVEKLQADGEYVFPSFAHASASLAPDARIGNGSVIMPNASVNAEAVVGDYCVINTASILEHDCILGDYSSLAPGAIVCGQCRIGDYAYIGAGAVIRHGLNIGENAVIGAGAVVVENVEPNQVVVGVPGRSVKTRRFGEPYL